MNATDTSTMLGAAWFYGGRMQWVTYGDWRWPSYSYRAFALWSVEHD